MTSRIADIACIVRITDTTPEPALRQAVALAAHHDAHLAVTLAVEQFHAPYSPLWSGYAASLTKEINDKAMGNATAFEVIVRREAEKAGVKLEREIVQGPFADIAARAAGQARVADLIVVDQQHGALDAAEVLLEDVLFHSGRPVLVASPVRAIATPVKEAVLAWDGSAHAARAVADALFVFPEMKKVEVVMATDDKDPAHFRSSEALARHLARKSIETVMTEIKLGKRSIGEALDAHAASIGADVLVMGAFGHSRLRQFLMGGATVELTSMAKLPLLMAY